MLATRELRGKVIEAFREAHLGKRLARIEGAGTDLCGELDILERREIGHEVVELEHETDVGAAVLDELALARLADVAAVDEYAARGRGIHAAEDVERGGLARTRGSEDDGQLAALDRETRPVERMDARTALAIGLDDVLEFDISHVPFPIWSDSLYCYPTVTSNGTPQRTLILF